LETIFLNQAFIRMRMHDEAIRAMAPAERMR
jgi:hypothetical protein